MIFKAIVTFYKRLFLTLKIGYVLLGIWVNKPCVWQAMVVGMDKGVETTSWNQYFATHFLLF